MTSRNMAWGLGGAAWLVLAACGGTKLNNVGDMPGDGGDGGSSSAGTAGKNGGHAGSTGKGGGSGEGATGGTELGGYGGNGATGGTEFGGNAGNGATGGTEFGGFGSEGGFGFGGTGGGSFGGQFFGGNGGTSFGGYAGGNFGGYGGSGYGCFDQFETYGDQSQLDVGPQNSVLLDVHRATEEVRNTANQFVFPEAGAGIWEAYANFPAVSPELAAKTDILLPAQLATVPDNVAQLYVTRRNCDGMPVAGHKLQVEVWWKSNGAFVNQPTQGFALGVLDKDDKAAWLADATKAFVVGDAVAKRDLNTLNRIIVQHTFGAKDMTDARKLVLGFWVLDGDVFPTSFYVGNVKWD